MNALDEQALPSGRCGGCPHLFAVTVLKKDAVPACFVDLWHDQSDGLPLYLRMKRMEPRFPAVKFRYWIEPTLLSSLRHMVLDRIFDETDNTEIRTFCEIETMLSDDYLRSLAPKLRQI